eukprot:TRINITY_DN2908_c0_g1_i1.p1 TRINITY_DN2908_c0_g1~~TRINITY_DN2908_c0_g1_i1.p1  ORF type:complete len:563 (-),score=162.98 TRINITY_DN2908_c0_g1_i1:64-1752(-)
MKRFNPFRFFGRRLHRREDNDENRDQNRENIDENDENIDENDIENITETMNNDENAQNVNNNADIRENDGENQMEGVVESSSGVENAQNGAQNQNQRQNVLVVVKIYPKQVVFSRLACVLKEIEFHSLYETHRSVANFYGTSRDTNNFYLVLELCPNGSLLHLSEKYDGNVPLEIVKYYAAELLNLLEFLHEKKVILYRALDMRKLLLDTKNGIKLVSFRRALPVEKMTEAREILEKKMFEEDIQFHEKKSNHERIARGCVPLFSPSLLHHITPKIDLWTLGAIIVFLLTGKLSHPPTDSNGQYRNDILGEYCLDDIEDPQILDFLNQLWALGSNGILSSKCEEGEIEAAIKDKSHFDKLKKHPFFTGIPIEEMENTTVPRIPKSLRTICLDYIKKNSRNHWNDSFKWETKFPSELLNKLFYGDITNLIEQRKATYLKKGEHIVKCGTVWHTNFFKWKFRAKLVLTTLPRFIIVDVEKNKKIEEFNWVCSSLEGGVPIVLMEVNSNGKDMFTISKTQQKRAIQKKFVLDSQDANEWVEAVHQSASTCVHSGNVAKGVMEPLN